jgi:Hemerythrin HHE cation binding domain
MPDTRAPEAPSISEHSRLLLAMHSAMRADGRRLTIATDIVADDPQSARELGRAVTELVTLIHDHHCTEDDVLYPFLVERWPGFVHDATQLEGDHIDLDAAMIHVTAGLRLLARPATARIRHDTRCGDRRDRAGGSSDEEAHIPTTVDGQVDESMVGVSGSA